MSMSAREALEVLTEVLQTDYSAAWDLTAPRNDNYIESVELIGNQSAWPFIKVTLGDGSNVCFQVMCVGA